jgi:16S rRNA (cytosine967-C5)-methyltransferase
MSKYHSYLNSAKEILHQYRGEEPFASFLKKFFSLDKKYGSRDRKQISHLCYCYFRLGKLKTELPTEERILLGLFLCPDGTDEILQALKPDPMAPDSYRDGWNEAVSFPLKEKLSFINAGNSFEEIFPFADELSDGIEKEQFILSHLKQPDVFLRLRPRKEEIVRQKLQKAGISFQVISNNCLALPNTSKIVSVIELNKEAVVQDRSSQRIAEFFPPTADHPLIAWDCCAGSGGKSIMLYDLYPGMDLTATDIRKSILINLIKRFREAGITNYKSFLADLTNPDYELQPSGFELILADVPCSGSGTWGRTPEQLYYFPKEKMNEYVSLQKKIVANIVPRLQPGGHLLYITCSVFKKENEEAAEFIKQKFHLQLIKMEVLKGYDKKADTMFAALFQKNL